jgi:xanthine dehydrogenase accessory factor
MSAARRRSAWLVSRLSSTGIERSFVGGIASTSRVQLRRTHDTVVLTESLEASRPAVSLFGAGHVGQAVAKVLATLPVRTRWIDSRLDFLPEDVGESMELMHAPEPLLTLAGAPPQSHFIVMTHNHALDYALCRAILQRGDFASVGVIGSRSKAAKFRSRLARDGFSAAQVACLRCPIGIDALHSKVPAVIAIAIAAQLLQTIEACTALEAQPTRTGLQPCDRDGVGCVACELLHQVS